MLVFNKSRLTAISFIILLVISGCSEETAQPLKSFVKPKTDKTINQQPVKEASLMSAEEATSKSTEPVYTYKTEGRRDPFKSLLIGLKEKKPSGLTPLQQRSLSELKVIGIMWENHKHTAMIETPDGKGYLVKEGALLGPDGGIIQEITEDSIVIEEEYTDYYGKRKFKKTVLRLHAKEEGGG